jgi:ribose/xylose/arabinose/galactoside ABC-type transport system permease subunit
MKLFIFLILLMIFMAIQSPTFRNIDNLLAVTQQMSELGIMAFGMTIVIITSGIDLSLGSIAGLTTVVIGASYGVTNNIVLSIFIGLIVAVLCGAFNGFIVARVGVPAILVTLGGQTLYKGIALVLSKGNAISNFPESYYFIGQGYIGPIPFQTIIFVILAIVTTIILKKTSWGQSVYCIGNNPIATKCSGIQTDKVLFIVYMIAALFAGISGWVISSRVATARADLGAVYVLQSVAAAVLGGTNIAGGSGNIIGTVIGVSVFAVLGNGLNHMGVSPFMQTLLMGVALIAVLLMNNYPIIKEKISVFIKLRAVRNA